MGVTAKKIIDGHVNVSSRYEALMGINEETVTGDEIMEGNMKERNTDGCRSAAGRGFKEKERLVGQNTSKAENGPTIQSMSRSLNMNGPLEGRKEREIARQQPSPKEANPASASGNKGKDKVEGYGVSTNQKYNHVVEVPRKLSQRETTHARTPARDGQATHTMTPAHNGQAMQTKKPAQDGHDMQTRRPAQDGHAGGSRVNQHPVEKNLVPKPPDETEWMDEGGITGAEETNMEDQVTPAGDFLVEDGMIRETYPC